MAAGLVEGHTSLSPAEELPRRSARSSPGETPNPTVTESEPVDSAAAVGARRLRLQGKLAAETDFATSETRSETSLPVRERFAMPSDAGRTESPDRAAVAEPEPRTVASPLDLRRGKPGDTPSAPVQAILAPRLPHPEPVAQSMQAVVPKPAEPTVHVTIGRVEIRAVSAPAAQKRSTPSKPALSLNDYLNRRSGGRG
jgi:hypothetical protein